MVSWAQLLYEPTLLRLPWLHIGIDGCLFPTLAVCLESGPNWLVLTTLILFSFSFPFFLFSIFQKKKVGVPAL